MSLLCSKCKKRPAVVFVSDANNPSAGSKGYCLVCAKEMGMKPVTEIMEKMGISEDDIEQLQDQMDGIMDSDIFKEVEEFAGIDGDDSEDSDDDSFSPGGAPTFPPFFKNLFNSKNPSEKLNGKKCTTLKINV